MFTTERYAAQECPFACEELRDIAVPDLFFRGGCGRAGSKDAMLRIAEDYEHLAQRAKDRALGRLSNSRTKTLEAKGGHT